MRVLFFFFETEKFCNETISFESFLNVLSNFLSPERSNFEVSKANISFFFLLYFTSVLKIQNQTCLTEKEMIEFESGIYVKKSSKRYKF